MGHAETPGSSWSDPDVVARYETSGYSDAGEQAALAPLERWRHGRVLDLGVGGGRTTGFLADEATSYVGIDLAPEQLRTARRRFPSADLRLGDVRHLTSIATDGFDLVVFSFNGLDSVRHDERALALAEMARATAPEGRVVYSGLNLDGVSYDERPLRIAGGLRSARSRSHLRAAARRPGSIATSVRNYERTKGLGEEGSGWGRRPLLAHEFRFVVHFATLEYLVAEAGTAGLEVLAVHADDGRSLAPGESHTDADYVHLVCRPRG